jgi:regulator of protease activity HflC (stomatin/prohibitin superfamily)
MNAEALAQTQVIAAKAEVERSRLLADADANRIRVTAAADGDRLEREALVLKENPLLIQKIVAEKLSDKMQIMMVPMDGQNFFANEIFKTAALPHIPTAPPQAAPSPSPTRIARHQK